MRNKQKLRPVRTTRPGVHVVPTGLSGCGAARTIDYDASLSLLAAAAAFLLRFTLA